MIAIKDLHKLSLQEWEIPASFRKDMRGSVKIFASQSLLEQILDDKSLEQAVNASTLPGLVSPVVVMPDIHQGYGFPIGGVAATSFPHGVISPGAIGYDINCGVRLLTSSIELGTASRYLDDLATLLNQYCPSGVGVKGVLRVNQGELERILRDGCRWAVKNGYAGENDLLRTEENGCMEGADPQKVSLRAKARGMDQLGSMGAGNHFVEVDVVDEIFESKLAATFGLMEKCLVVQVHSGSRGLGHQVCTDYVQEFQPVIGKYQIHLPDRELVCAPMDSKDGQAYLGAMRAAANFAFVNRQLLANSIRQAFNQVFSGKVNSWHLNQVYDTCHNMGKIENHLVDGTLMKVCVHRKGATRAFGPGSQGLPPEYANSGQPVLVPGSMGTASWVLAGAEKSRRISWSSCCHGAGRKMSRARAKHEVRGEVLLHKLEAEGIHVRAGSLPGLAEETPSAYKDVDEVVETVVNIGIARKVARLRPLVVIKG